MITNREKILIELDELMCKIEDDMELDAGFLQNVVSMVAMMAHFKKVEEPTYLSLLNDTEKYLKICHLGSDIFKQLGLGIIISPTTNWSNN